MPIWKVRHSVFSFYEPLTPPYVFWCYGLTWHNIELMQDGDKLPVKRGGGVAGNVRCEGARCLVGHGPRRKRLGANLPEEAEASRVAPSDGGEVGRGSRLLDVTQGLSSPAGLAHHAYIITVFE